MVAYRQYLVLELEQCAVYRELIIDVHIYIFSLCLFFISFSFFRLFDSQNNNRGGYNVGNMYYYEGSILPIEWTNQHSCADQNSHCEMILQYMCDDRLRDGSSTK